MDGQCHNRYMAPGLKRTKGDLEFKRVKRQPVLLRNYLKRHCTRVHKRNDGSDRGLDSRLRGSDGKGRRNNGRGDSQF